MDNIDVWPSRNSKPEDYGPRFLFSGDLVLSGIWDRPMFGNSLSEWIRGSDYTCVNLEAPLKAGVPIDKDGPTLSTIQETPNVLSEIGVDIVCLANNHIMDYGFSGVEKTKDKCSEAGIASVGTGKNRDEAIKPYHHVENGYKVAFYNVCQHEFGIASAIEPGTAWIDSPGLIREIMQTTSEVDFVFIVVHGGNEHTPLPSIRWQERLRELVEAGADAVIAHHPHVPQGWEIYNGCPIFYSLGNFVFDQTKFDANQWGYCVELSLKEDMKLQTNILMTERIDNRIYFMGQERNIESHYDYLENVTNIIETSPTNPGYWQEVAHQLYCSKYRPFFRRLGVVDPVKLYRKPTAEIRQMLHLTTNHTDWSKIPGDKKLKFLNYLRAEAHREAAIAGLEVEIGAVEDHRTPDIKTEVNDMFEFLRK